MEKPKFTEKERVLIISIAKNRLEKLTDLNCCCCEKKTLKDIYLSIIEKAEELVQQKKRRFNETESYILVELISDRIERLNESKELEEMEKTLFQNSYQRLIITIGNFVEERSPSEIYLEKKRQKSREEILKTKTPIMGDMEQLRIQEMNQQ